MDESAPKHPSRRGEGGVFVVVKIVPSVTMFGEKKSP